MKRISFAALAALVLALGSPALAIDQDYNDPAMHFGAPADFTRVPLEAPPDDRSGSNADAAKVPVAIYVYHAGKPEAREIVITIDPDYDGALDDFERGHESDMRQGSDGTFVTGKTKITLANGMPAWFVRINSGNEVGHFIHRCEYLLVDGKRSIDVAYVGRQGDFEDKDVVAAFSTLSVVLYPRHGP